MTAAPEFTPTQMWPSRSSTRTGTRSLSGAFSCVIGRDASILDAADAGRRAEPDGALGVLENRRARAADASPSFGPEVPKHPLLVNRDAPDQQANPHAALPVRVDRLTRTIGNVCLSYRSWRTVFPSHAITPLSAVQSQSVSSRIRRERHHPACPNHLRRSATETKRPFSNRLSSLRAAQSTAFPRRSLWSAIVCDMPYAVRPVPENRLSAWPVATHTLPSLPTVAVRTPSLVTPSSSVTLAERTLGQPDEPAAHADPDVPFAILEEDRGDPARRCSVLVAFDDCRRVERIADPHQSATERRGPDLAALVPHDSARRR